MPKKRLTDEFRNESEAHMTLSHCRVIYLVDKTLPMRSIESFTIKHASK